MSLEKYWVESRLSGSATPRSNLHLHLGVLHVSHHPFAIVMTTPTPETSNSPVLVHVYRNRSDDNRTTADLHFCSSCEGWYGVPHTDGHCKKRGTARWRPEACACRFCKEATHRPIQGAHGEFVPDHRKASS